MVVLNGMSRFHLATVALRYASGSETARASRIGDLEGRVEAAVRYAREHFEDAPDILDWRWTDE
jgi:xylulose-5-phosphate/fructose-6-phosphate phosphoketolase